MEKCRCEEHAPVWMTKPLPVLHSHPLIASIFPGGFVILATAPESCNRIMELELFSTIAPRNYIQHPEGVSLTTIAKSYVTKTLVYKTFSVFSKEKQKNSSWFRVFLVSHTNTRQRQANLSMGSLERVSKPCIYALLRWWKSQQKTKIKILEFVY